MSKRPARGERLLFAALLAVYLVPLWSFRYFPSADGPAHTSNARIISEYNRPDRAIFRQYYSFNPVLEPNWSGHLAMAGLMRIVSPLTAEKLLVSAYIVLLPLSIRYALAATGGPSFLAILGFPFIYSSLLHAGMYNFCCSLAVFFFVVGYWFKHRGAFTVRRTVVLGLLSLLLYFCHILSLLMAYVGIAVLAAAEIAWEARRGAGLRAWGSAFPKHVLPPVLAGFPALALSVVFAVHHGSEGQTTSPLDQRLLRFFSLHTLMTFDRRELIATTAVAAIFGLGVMVLLRNRIKRRELDRRDGLLVLALIYTAIYLIGPDAASSGSGVVPRLLLYPFFALLLWLGTGSYRPAWRRTIQASIVAIGLGTLTFYGFRYAELNRYLNDYLSGMDLIRPDSTVLPLCFDYRGHRPDGSALSLQTLPFWQPGGYIATQKQVVDLRNYEAVVGYFPLVFRPELSPARYIGVNRGLFVNVPRVDFLNYSRRTSGSADYVLLWLLDPPPAHSAAAQSIFDQLAAGYELIHVSPLGYARLYRRKAPA